jgi:excisionase family DNA binding protein
MGNDVAGGTGEVADEMSEPKLLLTAAEVAALTGFSEGTIRHWISQRRIPVIRISARCVRLRRSDIDRWIAERVVEVKAINVPASRRGK